MSSVHQYFLAAAVVWSSYFAGEIGMAKRDAALKELQARFFSR